MRSKVVPDPHDVDELERAQRAVPLVPDPVEDCCTRIRDELALPSREAAREMLTFLEALGLVTEIDRGYKREQVDPSDVNLGARFEQGVFGARELLAALAEEPLDAAGVFEEIRPAVPRWERDRHPDWEREWRERVERLLAWSVELGLVERSDGQYLLVE